jgi:hypothetical protein
MGGPVLVLYSNRIRSDIPNSMLPTYEENWTLTNFAFMEIARLRGSRALDNSRYFFFIFPACPESSRCFLIKRNVILILHILKCVKLLIIFTTYIYSVFNSNMFIKVDRCDVDKAQSKWYILIFMSSTV